MIYKIQEFSSDEKKNIISLEGLNIASNNQNNINNVDNQEKIQLNCDLTDFRQNQLYNQRILDIKEITKSYEKNNITTTLILKDIMKIVQQENQKFSIIRENNSIEDLIYVCDERIYSEENNINSDFYDSYSYGSSILQNKISNSIRKKILIYNEKEILPKTLDESYLDILIDISQMMSEDQRLASLLLCTGLSIPFSKYGVKIRISVFGERDNVWLLSKEFSSDNIIEQLYRLRDALSCTKRIQSFPADALRKLKNSFLNNNEGKYIQILISNLISAQVIDKKLDWNILGQRIIIFGLKSSLDIDFVNENKDIYENILKIPSSGKNQIIQQFFESTQIISQTAEYSKLINIILDDLLSDNSLKHNEELFRKVKIYERISDNISYDTNKNLNYLKKIINENTKEEKYFSQNIPFSMMNLSKSVKNEIQTINEFPNIIELEKLSFKNDYIKDNSLEDVISLIRNLLTPIFRQILLPNVVTGKIPCTSGGRLSIQGIKKWICSGFTYSYIFEKQGGKKKKKYNLSFIIDLSQSSLLLCNYSHTIVTIVLLLISPSTVEDSDEIYIDIIFNSFDGIKIIDFNAKCSIFQNILKINELIGIIKKDINFSCCPGSCLNTAYQLLLKRREAKKIILITDGFVKDKYEIDLVLNLIQKCENDGIDLITIGVGSFPNGIKDIYPNCCYSPSIRTLHDSLFSCFILPKGNDSDNIEAQISLNYEDEKYVEKLFTIIKESSKDKKLKQSIDNRPLKIMNMIINENIHFSKSSEKLIENPEEEPYYDIFGGFKILIVILYLGNDKHDKNITTEIFENNAGMALKKKGFKYDIVYSYGDAIQNLTISDHGNCPYSESWIFCSKGDGSLPEKAIDKDPNKITRFLELISEFNKNGGALFLFCDNYPFVLESNLLLKKYLQFEEGINFEMKGSYNNNNPEERFIYVKGKQKSKNGYFRPEHFYESPGEAEERLSLRIGLNKFSEGITLSYAETFDNSENYKPFTPFAYLSDPTKLRPFILDYDPKIKKKGLSRGPIVVHGGFTSAFYDFQEEGTGRLVISIACWLIRKEEIYLNNNKKMKIPRLYSSSIRAIRKFNDWINKNISMYSILILDVSGSMEKFYDSLIQMTNKIIKNQQKNNENEGVVIFFANDAKVIISRKYRLLSKNDIKTSKVGGGTDFLRAFKEAEKYIYNKNCFTKKRILFLTDGLCDSSQLQPICDKMIKENFEINIVGFENQNLYSRIFYKYSNPIKEEKSFEHLRKFASKNCFYTSNNFKDIEQHCENIFAAE